MKGIFTCRIIIWISLLYNFILGFNCSTESSLVRVKRFTDTRNIIQRKSRCPEGWLETPTSCFKYFDDPLSMEAAQNKCSILPEKASLARVYHLPDLEALQKIKLPQGRVNVSGNTCGYLIEGTVQNISDEDCDTPQPYYCWLSKYVCREEFVQHGFFCYNYTLRTDFDLHCTLRDGYYPLVRTLEQRPEILAAMNYTYDKTKCVHRYEAFPRNAIGRNCSYGNDVALDVCTVTPKIFHPNCPFDPIENEYWKENHGNGMCYFIEKNKIYTWFQARDNCTKLNGRLLIIPDSSIQLFVEHIWGGREFDAPTFDFWIGMRANKWEEDDNVGITYSRIDQTPTKQCTYLNLGNYFGQWRTASCTRPKAYICERKGLAFKEARASKPTVNRQKDNNNPKKPQTGCDTWTEVNGECHFFVLRNLTFEEAHRCCYKLGAHILEVHSEAENKLVSEMPIPLGYKPVNNIWIGLNSFDNYNTFKYAMSSSVTRTFWKSGYPKSILANLIGDCVWVDRKYKNLNNWENVDCNKRAAVICQRLKPSMHLLTEKDRRPNCNHGNQITDGPFCYELFLSKLRFNETEPFCLDRGGQLVRIESKHTQSAINRLTYSFPSPYYIGLTYNKNARKWVWRNGFLLNQKFALLVVPNLTRFQDPCVVGLGGIKALGSWNIVNCVEKHHFICQFPRAQHLPKLKEKIPKYCFQRHIKRGLFCNSLHRTRMTFMEAQKTCRSFAKGYLASFSTFAEAKETSIALGNYGKIRIGLKKSPVSQTILGDNPFIAYEEGLYSNDTCLCLNNTSIAPCDCEEELPFICQNLQEYVSPVKKIFLILVILVVGLFFWCSFCELIFRLREMFPKWKAEWAKRKLERKAEKKANKEAKEAKKEAKEAKKETKKEAKEAKKEAKSKDKKGEIGKGKKGDQSSKGQKKEDKSKEKKDKTPKGKGNDPSKGKISSPKEKMN